MTIHSIYFYGMLVRKKTPVRVCFSTPYRHTQMLESAFQHLAHIVYRQQGVLKQTCTDMSIA